MGVGKGEKREAVERCKKKGGSILGVAPAILCA